MPRKRYTIDHLVLYFGNFWLLLLYLNFSHKNDPFWIWAQLMKWRASSLVSPPTQNFENFPKLDILLQFDLRHILNFYWISIYRMTRKFCHAFHYNSHLQQNFHFFEQDLYLIWNFFTLSSKIHSSFKSLQKNWKLWDF
jgi:hypothetical protein